MTKHRYGAPMRHIGTLIAAIVIGPLAWMLLAFGEHQSAEAFAHAQSTDSLHHNDFVRPVLLLAGAGILLGLIATLRFSPLGAVLTGLVYAASYLVMLVEPRRLLDLLNHDITVAGQEANLATPVQNGTALLLGGVLLVGVFSVHRWRRWPRPDVDATETVRRDDSFSFRSARDRPLGAEGLGLTNAGWTTERDQWTPRPAEAERAMAGGPDWGASRWHSFWDAPR